MVKSGRSGRASAAETGPDPDKADEQRIQQLEAEIETLRASSGQLEVYAADLQQTYGELRRRLAQMQALHGITVRVSSQLNSDLVLSEALEGLKPLLPHENSAAYVLDTGGRHAVRRLSSGAAELDLPEWVQIGDGPIGQALLTGAAASLISSDARWLVVPLRTASNTLGALVLGQTDGAPLSGPDRQVAEMLAAVAAHALQNAQLYRQVEEAAITDALTSVYNYRYFRQQLPLEIARARRLKYPLGLVIADLDHFKQINDLFGHPMGDRVLREAARAMQQVMRRSDLLARVGGEEFAAMLPACSSADVYNVGDKLRAAIAELPEIAEGDRPPMKVSISVGGTTSDGEEDAAALIRRADAALLCAKRRGRDCTVVIGTGVIGEMDGQE